MTTGCVPRLNPYLALSQPACSVINLSWARNSALPTPCTAGGLLPTRVHESHPYISQYPQEKGPPPPIVCTYCQDQHFPRPTYGRYRPGQVPVQEVWGGWGLAGTPGSNSSLQPSCLRSLEAEPPIWEVSGKFPQGGRWSQIGLCAMLLRVAGAQRKQSCKELASAELWGW